MAHQRPVTSNVCKIVAKSWTGVALHGMVFTTMGQLANASQHHSTPHLNDLQFNSTHLNAMPIDRAK
jgi:hypothetical protein